MSNEDTLKLIGKVLPPGIHADRDAIHVAVLPVISDEEYICAGMRLNFKYGSRTNVVRAKGREYDDPGVGIADPFLIEEVKLGQRFFMFMKPGSVTGMRHHWNHAGVDTVFPEESESEKWMRTFAQKWNFNYEELRQAPPINGAKAVTITITTSWLWVAICIALPNWGKTTICSGGTWKF